MKRPDTLTSDDVARDAWTDSESRTGVPPGVPPLLSVRACAAALGIEQREMSEWVQHGKVEGAFQPAGPGGKYWVPAEMLLEFTRRSFYRSPDWEAAIEAER